MSLKRLLGLGLLGAGLSTSIATAQVFDDTNITVDAFNGHIPMEADAGKVDVCNLSSKYVHVEVNRKIRNPPPHFYCPNCEAACDGANPLGTCTFGKTDVLLLAPSACDFPRSTGEAFDCMPNGSTSANDCCDNGSACAAAAKVCSGNQWRQCTVDGDCLMPSAGTCIPDKVCSGDLTTKCTSNAQCSGSGNSCIPRPFCPVYTLVEVRVIDYGDSANGSFTAVGTPICSLYQAAYPGGLVPPANEDFDGYPTCGYSNACW